MGTTKRFWELLVSFAVPFPRCLAGAKGCAAFRAVSTGHNFLLELSLEHPGELALKTSSGGPVSKYCLVAGKGRL